MKTYNNKSISKKNIESILRTQDSTQIYRLVHVIYGGEVTQHQVYTFIHEFAPSAKVFDNAYKIAYCPKVKSQDTLWSEAIAYMNFKDANQKHMAIEALREQLKDTRSRYAKRPMIGNEHLWFCSPEYGFNDYNKWRSLPVKGNERFCETIVKLADKYFN